MISLCVCPQENEHKVILPQSQSKHLRDHREVRRKGTAAAQKTWFGHKEKCVMCLCAFKDETDLTNVSRGLCHGNWRWSQGPGSGDTSSARPQLRGGWVPPSRLLCVWAALLSSLTQQGLHPCPAASDHLFQQEIFFSAAADPVLSLSSLSP